MSLVLDLLVVAGLAATAWRLRATGLGVSSLWLDDAWVALIARADGLTEARLVGSTSLGFVLILKGWFAVFGFSNDAAQAIPFFFGVAGPPAFYATARLLGLHSAAALVGGLVFVVSPDHTVYATRVKQYTLDALLVTLLLGAAGAVLLAPGRWRRWLLLLSAATAATVISGSTLPVVVAAFGTGVLALLRLPRSRWLPGIACTGAYGVIAASWWVAVLQPAANPVLQQYWAAHYIRVGEGAAVAVGDLGSRLSEMAVSLTPFPPALTLGFATAAVLVLVAVRPLWALLLTIPFAVAAVLAALRLAPLGGGRTDIYLLPALAGLAAAFVGTIARLAPRGWAAWVAAAAAVVVAVRVAPGPVDYPPGELQTLVRMVDREAAEGDTVVVYPHAGFSYALYTDHPVYLVPTDDFATGFRPEVDDEDVRILDFHEDESRYREPLRQELAGVDQAWVLTSLQRDDLPVLQQTLDELGLEERRRIVRDGGVAIEASRE